MADVEELKDTIDKMEEQHQNGNTQQTKKYAKYAQKIVAGLHELGKISTKVAKELIRLIKAVVKIVYPLAKKLYLDLRDKLEDLAEDIVLE